jgi:hypothetical protein
MKQKLTNLLDYQQNPVLFLSLYYKLQVTKILKCYFVKDYHPKYRTW